MEIVEVIELLLLPSANELPVLGNISIRRDLGPFRLPIPPFLLSRRNGMTLLVPVNIGTWLTVCYILK